MRNPKINNFSPENVIAGIGDEITIYGENFGTEKGIVQFKNADNGGKTYTWHLDNYYIKEWTDTMIKVIIPSRSSDIENHTYPAGTGLIRVLKADNNFAKSNKILTVDYALLNLTIPVVIGNQTINDGRVYLAKKGDNNGITFILHKNVRNNIGAIHCIEKALCAWSSHLGISLKLQKNDSGDYDTVNITQIPGKVVIWHDPNLSAGMRTILDEPSGIGICSEAGTQQQHYYVEDKAHIRFGNSRWNYNTRKADEVPAEQMSFYNAFLHEVGHVLGLTHIINDGALMHSNINITNPQPIIDLSTTGGTPLTAVNGIITDSQALEWQCQGPSGILDVSDIEQLPPTIESYAINNGAPTVGGNGMVNLTNKCNVCPSHYMASESPSFSGATWQDYDAWATNGQPYNLSGGEGNKTVYFKVKNAIGTSERDDDNIYYDPDWMPSDTTGNNDPIKKERRLFIHDVNHGDIIIYPMPCNDILHINISDFQQDYYQFEVVDMRSAIVLKGIINTPNKTIDVSRLTKGTYILRLIGKDKVYIRKLIKQ